MRNLGNISDLYEQVKLNESKIKERKLTDAEKDKLKKLEKEVPMKDFKDRYGKEGEAVYYATLTKMAKKEGFASDAQRRAAFAQGYKAKGKKGKKEETELNEKVSKDLAVKILSMNKNIKFVFDPSLDQVVDLMNTHKIFLNPTMLEAGHPNLTMLEAAACGLPIIADWEENVLFNGASRAPRDVFKMIDGYHVIMDNYKDYSKNAFLTARELSWYKRSKELVKIYENYVI